MKEGDGRVRLRESEATVLLAVTWRVRKLKNAEVLWRLEKARNEVYLWGSPPEEPGLPTHTSSVARRPISDASLPELEENKISEWF